MLMTACIAMFFAGYIFFDAMAVIARGAAAERGKNAFGAAIEKMMSTMKRIMIFSYPPLLGLFLVRNDIKSLFVAIFASYAFGTLVLIVVIILRKSFFAFFCRVTDSFATGNSALGSFRDAWIKRQEQDGPQCFVLRPTQLNFSSRLDVKLFILASWISFVFGAAIFFVNVISLIYLDFAPILLQTLGLVNGIGTLVLAFWLDPAISRFLDSRERLNDVMLIILFAQVLAVSLLGPAFFVFVIAIL